MTELGELEKKLNMQVKATPENTAWLCGIHIDDAKDLLQEAIEEGEPLDIEDMEIIKGFLEEALAFNKACQELMDKKADEHGVIHEHKETIRSK